MDCDQCGRDIENMPYTCTGCEEKFCVEHRLPEDHDCVALKIEEATQAKKREQGEGGPWFKDEFRLSNVESSSDSRANRRWNKKESGVATEECVECGKRLREHKIAGCPHCGEPYCGEDIAAHRRNCDKKNSEDVESSVTVAEHSREKTSQKREERKTRTDKLEKERQKRFSSPNVNLDGSLSEAQYGNDIQSINPDSSKDDKSTNSGTTIQVTLIVSAAALLVVLVYLFVL